MITILVLRGIRLFWPDLIGNELYQWIQDILLVIGGIGAGDKIRKRLTFKNNK